MANEGLTVRIPYSNSGSSNVDRNRNIHAEMVQLLDSAPGWQRISSYYGVGGATGLDATGGANPSGEEAFVVYRNVSGSQPYDIAIKWSWSNFYTGGQFEAGASNWGVGIAVAFHSSSQAWNGTTDNDGADTFPSGQPWKSGSVIFPRQNAFGGVHATEGDREYMGLFSLSLAAGNMISACDNENIFFAYNDNSVTNAAGAHDTVFYFGKYIPLSGGNINFPYVYFCETDTAFIFRPMAMYGATTESDATNHGISFNSASIPNVGRFLNAFIPTINVNSSSLPLTSGTIIYEHPTSFTYNESLSSSPVFPGGMFNENVGLLGYTDFIRFSRVSDIRNLDRADADTRLFISRSAAGGGEGNPVNPAFISIPWISGTTMPTGSSTSKTTELLLPFITSSTGAVSRTVIFRGENPPGTFVYSQGSPPIGATNVIIVGYV